jgi:ABC-type ATPase involved in cell division
MIVFDQVTVTFGNGTVGLADLSFAIGEGEFVVIEGPSGAGKTTLMRTIIKDVTPTKGNIVIDGDDLSRVSPQKIPV